MIWKNLKNRHHSFDQTASDRPFATWSSARCFSTPKRVPIRRVWRCEFAEEKYGEGSGQRILIKEQATYEDIYIKSSQMLLIWKSHIRITPFWFVWNMWNNGSDTRCFFLDSELVLGCFLLLSSKLFNLHLDPCRSNHPSTVYSQRTTETNTGGQWTPLKDP